MKSEELLIFGAVAIGAIVLLTKGKAGNYLGESVGSAVVGVGTGVVTGGVKTVKNFIDTANEAGKDNPFHLSNLSWTAWSAAQRFKNLGNDDRWLW